MLLPTKLRPRMARERTLERPRVVEAIERCVALPLTLIVGPAGAGKSTAVTSWLEHTHAAVGWLSLERADDQPMRFFAYLFAALRTIAPTLSLEPAELLHAPERDAEGLELLLADELIIPLADRPVHEPIVLVLDDYHLIHDQRIHAALAWLLDARPVALHLVLLARHEPLLPLARFRARGELGELHETDLRFSLAEAERFYAEVMGITLAPERVRELEARTEGWPAGAQLAALSLRSGGELPSGDDRRIAAYLLDEVFAALGPEQREFLLTTALTERFCAPLAAAMLGDDTADESDLGPEQREGVGARAGAAEHDPSPIRRREKSAGEHSRALLDELERANLFVIPLDVHARWFRYHHLFGEFLRQRAAERGPEWLAERHARAARWLASRDHREEAFEYALQSDDRALICELFEGWAVATLAANQTGVVRRWIERVPAELRDGQAVFAFMSGWCDVIIGQLVRGASSLDRAEAMLAAGAAGPTTQFVIPHMGPMLRIAIEQRAGRQAEAIARCHACLAALPDIDQREVKLGRASFLLQEAQVRLELGELELARELLERAEPLMRIEPTLDIVVLAHLAQAQRRLGRLDEAERSIRRALAYAEQSGVLERSGAGLARIEAGALALARGDARQAIVEVRAGLDHNRLLYDLTYINHGIELLARAHAAAGEREDALELLDEALVVLEGTDMTVALARMQALRRELAGSVQAIDHDAPSSSSRPSVYPADELTSRELEVLALLATGLANRDIAKRLHVSVGTIKTHVHRILAKLDVGNRTQAVHRARAAGLLRGSESGQLF
jgi:LuxR family maltose regulon positive regulatory protein